MLEPTFTPWPKIARLFRPCVITEKIDGTNAAVVVTDDGHVWAQSRTRLITPGSDNFGFAAWVDANRDELMELGPGHHFGEWYGSGIQRGYGLEKGEKRFMLFNTSRWCSDDRPACCEVSTILYEGPFETDAVDDAVALLRCNGSAHVPGFNRPEGIIVYHTAANSCFKVTLEKDDEWKGATKA